MDHLIGGVGELGWVAAKAVLLYLTAVLCLRVGQGRTLADLSPFDFVAVAAVGSVVGRLPSATNSSYLAGAATPCSRLAPCRCQLRTINVQLHRFAHGHRHLRALLRRAVGMPSPPGGAASMLPNERRRPALGAARN